MGASKVNPVQQHAHQEPIDEQHVQEAHQQAYQGGAKNLSASSLGGAAAMQVSASGLTCYPSSRLPPRRHGLSLGADF